MKTPVPDRHTLRESAAPLRLPRLLRNRRTLVAFVLSTANRRRPYVVALGLDNFKAHAPCTDFVIKTKKNIGNVYAVAKQDQLECKRRS